jgi:lipoyl(octanoyl) transferase
LNVSTDLDYFSLIVPCGIADRGVTSLEAVTGGPRDIDEVETAIARQFARVFDRDITP